MHVLISIRKIFRMVHLPLLHFWLPSRYALSLNLTENKMQKSHTTFHMGSLCTTPPLNIRTYIDLRMVWCVRYDKTAFIDKCRLFTFTCPHLCCERFAVNCATHSCLSTTLASFLCFSPSLSPFIPAFNYLFLSHSTFPPQLVMRSLDLL